MFERGNPYKNVDPTGHEFLTAIGVLVIGVIVLIFAIVFLASELTKPLAVASITNDEKEYNQLYEEAKQANPSLEEPYVTTTTGTERRYTIEELEEIKKFGLTQGLTASQHLNLDFNSNLYEDQANPQAKIITQNPKQTTNRRGSAFGGEKDKAAIEDLASASDPKNNTEGKTAGEIIREWRDRQK